MRRRACPIENAYLSNRYRGRSFVGDLRCFWLQIIADFDFALNWNRDAFRREAC